MKILFSSSLFLISFFSNACDCATQKAFTKENIQSTYKIVFLGKVTSLTNHDGKSFIRFDVIEPFIGKIQKETELLDPNSDCAISFAVGEEWLVYANFHQFGVAETNICTRSRKHFTNDSLDYFKTTFGSSFQQDKEFLEKNLGVQPFLVKDKDEELLSHRELLKPKGYEMVWMVIIGTLCLTIFSFVFKKYFK